MIAPTAYRADPYLLAGLPADLTEYDQWVLWRFELRGGKTTKLPVQRDGSPASTTDPATWTDYQTALDAYRSGAGRFAGIGFVFSAADPYAGIDLDDCFDKPGQLKPYAVPIVERFHDTYIEISPSGKGLKIFYRAKLPGRGLPKDPAACFPIEIYDCGRFFTTTGRRFNDAPLEIAEHQSDNEKLYSEHSCRPRLNTANGSSVQPGKIPQGHRHTTLVSLAGTLRRRGASANAIDAALQAINNEQCEPPYDRAHIRQIAESAQNWTPDSEQGGETPTPTARQAGDQDGPASAKELALLKQPFNDYGNGQRLIAMHGKAMRYCHAFRSWLVWTGSHWAIDRSDAARKLAQETMLEFAKQALASGSDTAAKFAGSCLNSNRITAAMREAEPHLAVDVDALDTDPGLLNFRNGTVSLVDGRRREHERDDLLTKCIPHNYNPGASCPTWHKFLARVVPGLETYLQTALGYSLTGETAEKVVFICYGGGNNGKTTLLASFRGIIGDHFAVLLQIDTLMARTTDNNSQSDLADLRGARFVMTSEGEEGQRLAEGKLKRITQGQGKIKAVRKYENPIEFQETHKLWMDTNHKPLVRGTDPAIWNRLHLIPFDVVIPPEEIDRSLAAKLLVEAEGILAWAVEGAGKWYRTGLGKPKTVDTAGSEWRSEMDHLGRFIEEQCVIGDCFSGRASKVYAEYKRWTEDGGEQTMTSTAFGLRLKERGFTKETKKIGIVYQGIGLRTSETNESRESA